MNTVKKRRIVGHCIREWFKQVRGLEQNGNILVDIADEDHRGRRRLFFLAAGKGAGRHVVLHDLHAVLVLEVDAGNFVERHTVPHTNKPYRLCTDVVEQVGNGGLAAGNKNAVW